MANEKRLIDATPLIDECTECAAIEWNRSVYTTWAEAEEDFLQRLLDASTVDAVEVVHGRWIHDCVEACSPFVDSLPVWVDVMQCSVCNEYIEGSHGTNYCPNCGAKMDGDGDE